MTQEELEKYEAKLDRDDEMAGRFGGGNAYTTNAQVKTESKQAEAVKAAPAAKPMAAAPKAEVAKFMKQNSAYYQAKMDAALEEFQKKMSSIQNEFKNDQQQAEQKHEAEVTGLNKVEAKKEDKKPEQTQQQHKKKSKKSKKKGAKHQTLAQSGKTRRSHAKKAKKAAAIAKK